MTAHPAFNPQILFLRRLRRNAWAAIGLCILLRVVTAMAVSSPAVPIDFKRIPVESRS